ncbi:MAG: hypothetical protein KXJ50_02115 [Vulcanococcus sp.]|jgi:hypothetical protein|uniref:hypothetical protein n=1 Tax=Vulcanococcus sp. TaxID=2856995 RepID=UPI0025E83BDB|nr:hypothetical protein [Vulcanococcus sp.]MBW0174152.1 hypothetical protein [Vulcanococcus sp.]MBW0179849.1 hypothetical protein [Vulcanococcus sp.]
MTENTDSTPLQPTFQQAMEITAQWLALWENGELSDEVLSDRVAELVASRDGARGFFVVSLAGDSPLMDRLPDPVVLALRQAGDGVVDLSARNLAMSTAMALHHQRNGDAGQQGGSERVQLRCTELLRLLEPVAVKERLETLLEATDGRGEDVAFLDRWGYDADQRAAIAEAVLAVAEG